MNEEIKVGLFVLVVVSITVLCFGLFLLNLLKGNWAGVLAASGPSFAGLYALCYVIRKKGRA